VQTIEAPKGGGIRGKGRLRVINDTQVGVTITDNEGKVHNISLEYPQGVSLVQIGNWKMQDVDDVFIQLEPDESDIKFIRPRNGTFYVVFSRFGSEPGELPTIRFDKPKDYQGDPWLPSRLKAFGLYEAIAAGVYSGMEILDSPTYEFEWDENKRRQVIRDHDLDFRDLRGVFDKPRIVDFDLEHSHGESRWRMLGYLDGNVVFVAYTKRGATIRLIPARKATREEAEVYYQQFFGDEL